LVLAIIYALRVFETAFLTTVGGPNYATWFYMLHLYFAAFRDFDMGYASALAWILFVLTLLFTWIQIKWSDRWVYYEGRDREGWGAGRRRERGRPDAGELARGDDRRRAAIGSGRLPAVGWYAGATALALLFVGPFFWALSSSLKSPAELYVFPPSLFPAVPRF